MEKVYAQAIARLQGEGVTDRKIFSDLITHLTEKGRMKLLPRIKRELEKLAAYKGKEYSKLEVASTKETAAALKELKKLGVEVSGSVVNKDLIRGWRTVQKDVLVDRSAKQQLVTLYTNIIK